MAQKAARTKPAVNTPTPEQLAVEEDAQIERYEFIPLHLRHDFAVEDPESTEETKGNQAVDAARDTRSAHLVASLLYSAYTEGLPVSGDAKQDAKTRRKPRSPTKSTSKTPPVQKATPHVKKPPEPQPTASLYSLQVEASITKRVTYERALKDLDAYFADLQVTVSKLNAGHDPSTRAVPSWVWESSKSRVNLPTMLQVQRKIVQSIASCLPECDVYLAMYDQLPLATPTAATTTPLLHYVAASPHSSMSGCVLERRASPSDDEAVPLSFQVMESLDPELIDDVAGTSFNSVQWFGPAGVPMTGPFACLPLVASNNSSGIGVLSIDCCRKAASQLPEAMSPQSLYEFLVRMGLSDAANELRQLKFGGRQLLQLSANDINHRPAYKNLKVQTKQRLLEIIGALKRGVPLHLPRGKNAAFFSDDDDVLTLLDNVCERAGPFLDDYRRSVHWLRVLAKRTRDTKTSALDVYAALTQAIANALGRVDRVTVWKIQACAEIDTIASTQLSDDRLQPFLQWNERLIRRVTLYCENNDDCGETMQGNITTISYPLTTAQDPAMKPCERATYHVSWSNRTQQALNWSSLRLILAVRPMNARHFQVVKLLEQLKQAKAASPPRHHVRLDDPNGVAFIIRDPQRPDDEDYVVQVDFPIDGWQGGENSSEFLFLSRAVSITQQNLTCVRGREVRMLRRQASTVKTTRNFQSIGFSPSPDALKALNELVSFLFGEITALLPGTRCQIAELQPDGSQLCFSFASTGSTLVGKMLNRGQGVSFRCIDSRTPLVITPKSELRSRLRYLGPPDGEVELSTELPYVFIPLLHEDACIGLLSINRFVDVPKGREDEEHPEDGIVEYLSSLAKPLATAIYVKRRAFAMYKLQELAREPLQSPEQLFAAACATLKDVMLGVWKTRTIELNFVRGKSTSVYEFSETARAQATTYTARRAIPFSYRSQELLPDTIEKHWQMTHDETEELRCSSEDLQREEDSLDQQDAEAAMRPDGHSEMLVRKRWERRVRKRYYRLRLDDADECSQLSPARHLSASIGARSSEKYVTTAICGSMASKTTAFAQITTLSRPQISTMYLAVAVVPQYFATCEQSFVDRVADTLSRMLEALISRVERSSSRVDILDEVSKLCLEFKNRTEEALLRAPAKPGAFSLSPAEELQLESCQELLDQVVRSVSRMLSCPYVYIALYEPFHRSLRYLSASESSSMKGKALKRGHGVSFYTLDHQQAIVIESATSRDQVESSYGHHMKLRFFASDGEVSFKWPFIVVPLGRVGVLALDNLEKYDRLSGERQPEIGLVDFLRRAARLVGEVILNVRLTAHQERRRRREEALVRVMAVTEDLGKRVTPLYIQHVVLQAIEAAFNGVDAYIGILQPLCSALVFTCATSRSSMAGQQVNATESVSFQVYIAQEPLVIPQLEKRQYDTSEQRTADLVDRLRWFTPLQGHGRRGPFVCIPIPYVGVLSVDTFPGAAGGCFSAHVPELGVVDCLTRMANLLGSSIQRLTADDALRVVPTLFTGNQSTFPFVFQEILEIIANNVISAVDLRVICYDETTSAVVHSVVAPLARRTTTVHQNVDTTMLKEAESTMRAALMSEDSSARCFQLPSQLETIIARTQRINDVDSEDANDISTSDLRSCRKCETMIVIRRVKGATWSSDVEFMNGLLPLIDDVVDKVNDRVCGIVARRRTLIQIADIGKQLEEGPSSEAASRALPDVISECLDFVVAAASKEPGDAYVGERAIGGLRLEYIAASTSSLMRGVAIDLLAQQSQMMASVHCLQDQHTRVIHLAESRDEKLVTPLTGKKLERVFIVAPMGEDRILGVDSLSVDAFDVQHRRLERDVEAFLREAALILETTIRNVRYRLAYDQLSGLKMRRHANLRQFYVCVHEILRRELHVLHSQQIIALASDFTGQFQIRSWHRAAVKRSHLLTGTPHFCFTNGCDQTMIERDLHYESRITLPMTNLPRALDTSRASGEPTVGREKQGAYACDCLATMLDAEVRSSPRIALCVYSHDHITRPRGGTTHEKTPKGLATEFSDHQRQFFFAFSSVASSVFQHVFRACVLETFSIEMLFVMRDRLNAKEAVLVVVEDEEEPNETPSIPVVRVIANANGLNAKKGPVGSRLGDRLAERVIEFQRPSTGQSTVHLITKTKTTRVVSPAIPNASPTSQPTAVTSTKASRSGPTSFLKRRLFGSKDYQTSHESTAVKRQSGVAQPPPSNVQMIAEFHLVLRGHHPGEFFSLHIERPDDEDTGDFIQVELCDVVSEMETHMEQVKRKLTGEEEWNAAGFAHDLEIGDSNEQGGGGFCVLSSYSLWQSRLRDEILHLETDMRAYLTGVQATSREQLGAAVAASIRPSLLPGHHSSDASIFLTHKQGAMALIRGALALCGYKKEVVIDSPEEKDDDLLKEYLRAGIGRKLLEVSPKLSAKWAPVLRAANHVRSKYQVILDVFGPTDEATKTPSDRAARSLLCFLLALASACKYFKYQQDSSKQRRLQFDHKAIVMQCFYRVVRARAELKRRKIGFKAALAIQCAFRQHLARRQLLFLKWTRSAITVQRLYRHKLAQRRGRRPRELTLELRSVAAQYGSIQSTAKQPQVEMSDSWKVEMESFDSFKTYLMSRVGREQLKREEHIIGERMKQVAFDREQRLTPHDRLLADVHDVFELLDVTGGGELTREATRELMTRLHVPLSTEEADDVIDMMDSDHSESISFDEFTNWFAHEYVLLRKRSRECGVLSKRDRQWMVEASAKSALRKRWLAHTQTKKQREDNGGDGNKADTKDAAQEQGS